LEALLAHATKSSFSPAKTIEALVALELRERDARNLARRTKAATLGAFKTMDQFDWNHPRTIDRDLCEELITLDFIGRGENVPAVLADLLRQESIPATERRLKRYTAPDLLVLDELGYVPCDSRAADLLFNIISRRHEKRSVVITTNLAFKQWGSAFHDASCLGALVDRFAQHCHVIDIEAESWRRNNGSPTPKQRHGPKAPRSGPEAGRTVRVRFLRFHVAVNRARPGARSLPRLRVRAAGR
jgi:DNA replication protein DnaC